MTDTIIGAIIGVGGAIIGAILAGPVTYYYSKVLIRMTNDNAIDLMRRQEFNKAALDFFEAFLPTIMSLDERYHSEHINDSSVCEIIEKTFPQQIAAMLRFRLYLPADKIKSFNSAWYEYCRYDVEGGPKYPFLEQYFEKTWNGQPTRELALKRIRNLLKVIDDIHPGLLNLEMKD